MKRTVVTKILALVTVHGTGRASMSKPGSKQISGRKEVQKSQNIVRRETDHTSNTPGQQVLFAKPVRIIFSYLTLDVRTGHRIHRNARAALDYGWHNALCFKPELDLLRVVTGLNLR